MNIRDFLLFAGLNGGSGGSGGGSCNIQRIESLDTSNLVSFRDLDSGVYVLYGYFTPFTGSDVSMIVDDALVSIARRDAGTHLMCFTALNGKINFIEILVDESAPGGHTYTRTDYKLSELAEQPDWNQNDSTKPDYVKNRTHWTDDPVETVILEEQTITFDFPNPTTVDINDTVPSGETVKVIWNGTVYNCETHSGGGGLVYFGNMSDTPFPHVGNNEPFGCLAFGTSIEVASFNESDKDVRFGISCTKREIHKIDPKYMPDGVANPVIIRLNDDLTFSRNGTPIETAEVCRLWDSGVNMRFMCGGNFGATVTMCAYAGEESYTLVLEKFSRMSGVLGRLHEWVFGPDTADYNAYDFTITKADV